MSGEAEGVQGGFEPQGAEGENSFVNEHLNSVPEDYRPHVEPYLRSIESNANERFREHADYRKQWEPYEELNLTDYDPEGLQGLLEFAELTQNPEQFKEWWTAVGQQSGFMNDLLPSEDDGEFDEEDGLEGLDLETFKGALNELLDERLGPIQQREQEREVNQQIEQANTAIDQQMQALHDQHGEFDEQAVYRFAYAHAESSEDPIQAGFEDYMKFVAQIENQTVNGRVAQPPPPGSGEGPANTNSQAPTSFEDAKAMARERMSAAQIR